MEEKYTNSLLLPSDVSIYNFLYFVLPDSLPMMANCQGEGRSEYAVCYGGVGKFSITMPDALTGHAASGSAADQASAHLIGTQGNCFK